MTLLEWEQRAEAYSREVMKELKRRGALTGEDYDICVQDFRDILEAFAVTYPGTELDKEHACDTNEVLRLEEFK